MIAKGRLAAVAGTLTAAYLTAFMPQFEGMILRGYKDPIGIVTACAGHTKTAVLGRPYTKAECEKLLMDDLAEHATGVMECLETRVPPGPRAAFISAAYNIGVPTFCRSTIARKANAGDLKGACAELDRWVYAGGQKLPGLVSRRAAERAVCEEDLS